MTGGGSDELNPSAWKDINEAVGEAISLPPAEAFDLLGDEPVALPQKKREGEAVNFQRVTNVSDLGVEHQQHLAALQDIQNQRNLSQAMKLFAADGSLLGEYAPMVGQNNTPDSVDAIWWLSLPEAQAKWELGIDKDDDATFLRVRRDIEVMAAIVINRMLQTRVVVPMVIRRKRNKINRALFQGGTFKRLKPVNPNDYPGMNTSKRSRAPKPDKPDTFDPTAPI